MANKQTFLTSVKRFVTDTNKGGAKGLAMVQACFDHIEKSGDWTPLAWMIGHLEGADSTRIRAIIGACTNGLQMKADSKQPSGYVFFTRKANRGVDYKRDEWTYDKKKMDILKTMIENNVSFRSKLVAEELLGKNTTPAFDLDKVALTMAKRLIKEGANLDRFIGQLRVEFEKESPKSDASAKPNDLPKGSKVDAEVEF